ncbi:uncharacterized protein LOC121656457 [Melanotaenia boesemani]|uniref:uncharacterized protein LOC121656457 n=1 Tax=Melanotaenia boesemani TaxID=1250792 RepID=UPI001C03CF8B|nr:uncharacterized protein LOC121656457 [Melanotaenia boesemani]
MTAFVVLVFVGFTVFKASMGHPGPCGQPACSPSQQEHRDNFMSKTFMEYASTEADPDNTMDFTQCHLKEKLNDLISRSQDTINNILMYIQKNVTPLTQKFLYKIRYEIDHALVHIRSFLKSLKVHHYSVSKDMENKLQSKLEDIKKDAEKQMKHMDPKAMQQALRNKMQEMKDDVKKDVKNPVHHKDDSKDLKKELEDVLEDFEKRLLRLTKDYERKVDTKTHNIFQKSDKGHNKKDKPNKPENKPSCMTQRDQMDNLWDSFCKKYR